MFERELTLYRFMDGYARLLLQDVTDEQMTAQPTPNANHPAWHLGHLIVVGGMALKMFGEESDVPAEWMPLFGRETAPAADPNGYPDKKTLMRELRKTHMRIGEAVPKIPAERLEEPNPIEDLRKPLPTLGDLVGHLLTTHEAMHMGQLAAWRNAMGLPRVF